MKKHDCFSAKEKKNQRRRWDNRRKKNLQQVSTLEKRNESAIITDYNTSFFLYVGVNPKLIKRLRYYTLTIMFGHSGFPYRIGASYRI